MGPFLLNKDPQWDGSGELGFVRTWGWGEGHPRGGWLSIIIIWFQWKVRQCWACRLRKRRGKELAGAGGFGPRKSGWRRWNRKFRTLTITRSRTTGRCLNSCRRPSVLVYPSSNSSTPMLWGSCGLRHPPRQTDPTSWTACERQWSTRRSRWASSGACWSKEGVACSWRSSGPTTVRK